MNGKLPKNNYNQEFSMILSNKNKNLNQIQIYIKRLQKTFKRMTGIDKCNKKKLLRKKSSNKTKNI